MTRCYRIDARSWALVALVGLLAACADQSSVAPAGRALSFSLSGDSCTSGDPEVFGNIYEQGILSGRADLTITIQPANTETASRLKGPFSETMWVSPYLPPDSRSYPVGRGFGWYDPRAACECGGLSAYLDGDTASRAREVHWESATQPPASTSRERHCIMPGFYHVRLSGPGVYQELEFEYAGVRALVLGLPTWRQVQDSGFGGTLLVEPREYTPYDSYSDHILNFDLHSPPREVSASADLRLQTAYSNPDASPFTPAAGEPAVTEQTYVRFSTRQRSGLNWLGPQGYGRALTQYFWDYGRQGAPGAYFVDDNNAVPIMRAHQFSHVGESRSVVVGVRLKEPDNDPNDTSITTFRTLNLTRVTPVACGAFEGTTTWLYTDQVLNAACSTRGASIQYRWQFDAGGPWTPYSADTLYDYFAGHSAQGTHEVTVEALNTTTQASSSTIYPFSVSASRIVLAGRTYVTDKANNLYTSNYTLVWREKFDHDTQWWPATSEPRTWMNRIWYAGVYTVDLRQQDSTPSFLRRGRLHITVCNPPSSCEPENTPAIPLAPAASSVLDEWGLFGAGPWLSWGTGNAVRFYDLIGAHDVPNRFADIGWLDGPDGQASPTGAGSYLSSTRRPLQTPEARAFDFVIAPPDAGVPFTFGLALDPDLGPNAADDEAGYDASRGMVYVFDGARAVGFLLRDAQGRSALRGVMQYGLARRSPLTAEATSTATRARGISLLTGRSDVQLLLTAPAQPGSVTWTFVLVRGASIGDLRTHADAVLAELISNR